MCNVDTIVRGTIRKQVELRFTHTSAEDAGNILDNLNPGDVESMCERQFEAEDFEVDSINEQESCGE